MTAARDLRGEALCRGFSASLHTRRVMPNLEAALASSQAIAGIEWTAIHPYPAAHGEGERLAQRRTERLFGTDTGGPKTRIMVTLDEKARADVETYVELLSSGADVARLNGAHGSPEVWGEHAAAWRVAASRCGRAGTVQLDLSGPKCRVTAIDGDTERSKRLVAGDRFVLCDGTKGSWKRWNDVARIRAAPSFPHLLRDLRCCNTVHYDDGALTATVIDTADDAVLLEVRRAAEDGVRLRVSKGLDFPGVELRLPVLGPSDAEALDFAAAHADVIGLSFVQRPEDVLHLQRELDARCGGRSLPGVVLKIETELGVRNLPRLIVQAGMRQPVGVMIARGGERRDARSAGAVRDAEQGPVPGGGRAAARRHPAAHRSPVGQRNAAARGARCVGHRAGTGAGAGTGGGRRGMRNLTGSHTVSARQRTATQVAGASSSSKT
jgi:pyruvate kinase